MDDVTSGNAGRCLRGSTGTREAGDELLSRNSTADVIEASEKSDADRRRSIVLFEANGQLLKLGQRKLVVQKGREVQRQKKVRGLVW
jgi:hypothetical protein